MATMPTIPGAAGGAVTGAKNAGMPVFGSAGRNQFSPGLNPTSIATKPVLGSLPGNPAAVTGQPPVPTTTGLPPNPTAGGGILQGGNPLAPGNAPYKLDTNINKQLTDIYGKGVGGALATVLQNLGSNDSSYIEAYKQAMAGQQAEDISTIGTSLGNAGISADSSTAAIEKADYMARSTAQLGMQEQQLIQQQTQDTIGILQGTQKDAASETASSWLDTFGQVAGIAGTFIGDATGLSSIGSGIKSVASMLPGFGGSAPPMLNVSGPSQLPGAISGNYPGAMPAGLQV